jgi:hypothetical protein
VGIERGAWHGRDQCVGAEALRKWGGQFMTDGIDTDIIAKSNSFLKISIFRRMFWPTFGVKRPHFTLLM